MLIKERLGAAQKLTMPSPASRAGTAAMPYMLRQPPMSSTKR